MFRFIDEHPHGFLKFVTVWTAILGVLFLIESAKVVFAGGTAYSDPIFAIFAFWWAWDAYDDLNRLLCLEEEANNAAND